MKKYLLLLFSLVLLQCSTGKISDLYQLYNTDNYIYWSDNRLLTWDDFQGEPADTSGKYVSEIHIYNPSSIEKKNIFNSATLMAICVFDKKHSWVNRKLATEALLVYNQTIFNIYELYTRILRKTFDSTDFGINDFKEKFRSMTDEINSRLKNRVEDFRRESNSGQDIDIIIKWANEIKNELDDLKKYRVDH